MSLILELAVEPQLAVDLERSSYHGLPAAGVTGADHYSRPIVFYFRPVCLSGKCLLFRLLASVSQG